MTRRVAALFLVLSTSLAVVNISGAQVRAHGPGTSKPPTLAECKKSLPAETYAKGVLTLGTDNPVLPPWFESNNPANQGGYEGALAYDIANEFGYKPKAVKWMTEPFEDAIAAGTKSFDFDINEVPNNSSWKSNVSFSTPYYSVTQSIIAMKSDPIVHFHSTERLPTYKYGALTGSPALTYATKKIKPSAPVTAFSTLDAATNALEAGSIDAIVVDTPTGYTWVRSEIIDASGHPLATQVGQFPSNGDESYVLLLQKGNPILACIDVAVSTLRSKGTLADLSADSDDQALRGR
jgi:polar amino acid transport system substrate-binding protein